MYKDPNSPDRQKEISYIETKFRFVKSSKYHLPKRELLVERILLRKKGYSLRALRFRRSQTWNLKQRQSQRRQDKQEDKDDLRLALIDRSDPEGKISETAIVTFRMKSEEGHGFCKWKNCTILPALQGTWSLQY